MDNLTHTAIGLFLGRAGLNRWTPRATAILLLSANAPDIDIITLAGGQLPYLNYHRHITHALVALPVLAALCVLLVRAVSRKPVEWAKALVVAAIGIASHLALDWTNVYGVRLLLPFKDTWYHGDLVSVIDLWIWLVVALAVAAPFLSRLVSGEIGATAPGRPPHGQGWSRFALVCLLLYFGGREILHTRAVGTLESRLYEGGAPVRVMAAPGAANPMAWRGLVETASTWSVNDVNLLHDFDPNAGTVYYKPEPGPYVEAARKAEVFRDFMRFSQFPLLRVETVSSPEEGRQVEVIDLRFGSPAAPGFMAAVTLDRGMNVVESSLRWGRLRPR